MSTSLACPALCVAMFALALRLKVESETGLSIALTTTPMEVCTSQIRFTWKQQSPNKLDLSHHDASSLVY
jgi:hypothetical protein